MRYQVGDKVIHWAYGIGTVTGLDEKRLSGKKRAYYVVELSNSTIWVPVGDEGTRNIHPPIPRSKFQELLEILNKPCEEDLPEDRTQRQNTLALRMKDKSCENICAIIRDLVAFSRRQDLNRNDGEVLNQAKELLLNEWELSLGIERVNAQKKLDQILNVEQ